MKTINMTNEQYKRQLAWTHNQAIYKFIKRIRKDIEYTGDFSPSIATIDKIAKKMYKGLK